MNESRKLGNKRAIKTLISTQYG